MDVKDARLHRRVVGVGDHADQLGMEGENVPFHAKLSAPEPFLI